jgi:hypothetical protein
MNAPRGRGRRGRRARRLTGEAGQALAIGLIAVAIFAGGLAVLVHAARGAVGREERAVPVGPAEYPTIGPPLPTDESQAACIQRIIGSRLTWTGRGWRDPSGHPETPLTGDGARDRGTVNAWTVGMQGYVNSIVEEWAPCLQRAPDTPAAAPPAQVIEVVGTYDISMEGGQQSAENSSCPSGGSADTLTVNRAVDALTLHISTGGMLCLAGILGPGSGSNSALRFDFSNLTGTIDADYYFRGDGNATVTVTPGSTAAVAYSMSGRFTLIDSKVELRDGVLSMNGSTLRYSAKKRA